MQIYTDEALIDEFKEAMKYLAQNPGNHYVKVVYGSKAEDRATQTLDNDTAEPKKGSRLHLAHHLFLVPKPPTDPTT